MINEHASATSPLEHQNTPKHTKGTVPFVNLTAQNHTVLFSLTPWTWVVVFNSQKALDPVHASCGVTFDPYTIAHIPLHLRYPCIDTSVAAERSQQIFPTQDSVRNLGWFIFNRGNWQRYQGTRQWEFQLQTLHQVYSSCHYVFCGLVYTSSTRSPIVTKRACIVINRQRRSHKQW